MRINKKILSLFFAGTMMSTVFCSCAKSENGNTDNTETTEAVTEAEAVSGSGMISLNI